MEPKKKQKKPLGSGVWALIFIVALSAIRGIEDPSMMGAVAAGIAFLVVISLVISAAAKAKKRSGTAPFRSAGAGRGGDTVPYRPAQTAPEYTFDGDSDTDRDRQRRREQLDGFLKNGIVDKREYDLLRARHEGRE